MTISHNPPESLPGSQDRPAITGLERTNPGDQQPGIRHADDIPPIMPYRDDEKKLAREIQQGRADKSRGRKLGAILGAGAVIGAAVGFGAYKATTSGGSSEVPKSEPSASAPAVPGLEGESPTSSPSPSVSEINQPNTGEIIGGIDTAGLSDKGVKLAKELTPDKLKKLSEEELTELFTIKKTDVANPMEYAERAAIEMAAARVFFTPKSVNEYNEYIQTHPASGYDDFMKRRYIAMLEGIYGDGVAISEDNLAAFGAGANRYASFELSRPDLGYGLTAAISDIQADGTTFPANTSAIITLKETINQPWEKATNLPTSDMHDMGGSLTASFGSVNDNSLDAYHPVRVDMKENH